MYLLIFIIAAIVRIYYLQLKSELRDNISEIVSWPVIALVLWFLVDKFGPLEIRYYGIVYVLGFLVSLWYLGKLSDEGELGLTREQINDMFTHIIIAVVVGARLVYVTYYEGAYYSTHLIEIFYVWHGGLSFHGGLIGVIAVIWYYSKNNKISFYEISDAIVIPASLALSLGRIANFLNGELVGRVTEVSWAFKFKGYEGFRHPSQLYESFKNLVIFSVLMFIKNTKPIKGTLTWSFVTLYGVLRFSVEFFREPDWVFAGLSGGQWLSLVMIPIGIYMLFRIRKNN